MLIQLNIKDFAIIETLELTFEPRLSVISGETGAGKSITVDAINILLGERADSSNIRHGQAQCEISGIFDISQIMAAKSWLQEQSLLEDELCHIRRIISNNGRSKAYINGRAMPIQSLKDLGETLVDIHGQHAHQSLLKKETQRQLLDQFANLQADVLELTSLSQQAHKLEKEIKHIKENAKELTEKAEFLKFQLKEFSELAPKNGEWESLSETFDQLSQMSSSLETYQQSATALNDENRGILITLYKTKNALQKLSSKDKKLVELVEMLDSAYIQIEEVESELSSKINHAEQDPETLIRIEQRMRQYSDLARKHRINPEDLVEHYKILQDNLKSLNIDDEHIAQLEESYQQLSKKWHTLADKISQERHKTAQYLNQEITAVMQKLAMEGGKFAIEFMPLETLNAYGKEQAEFMVSANPGQPLQSIGKVASGGELARISLAIQVIMSLKSALPTLIFDEVDSGVGGAVAEIIGKHLQTLSLDRQVFCVTHLPQVASFGHQHFKVEKVKTEQNTSTNMRLLDDNMRIEEIARMLGGIKLTDATRQHAQEMLAHAHGN